MTTETQEPRQQAKNRREASELSGLLCAKRGLIQIAARLAMCNALHELEEVCENQQSISSRKLQDIVDRASTKLKDEAVYIRNMTNKISI